MYVYRLPYHNELYHYGILGQKWGVRRYQTSDGRYTSAGKERYRNAKALADNARAYKKQLKKEDRIYYKTGQRVDLDKVQPVQDNPRIKKLLVENTKEFYDIALEMKKLSDEAISIRDQVEHTKEFKAFKSKIEPTGWVDSDDEVFDHWVENSNSKEAKRLTDIGNELRSYSLLQTELAAKIANEYLGKYGDMKVPDGYRIGNVPLGEIVSSELEAKGRTILYDVTPAKDESGLFYSKSRGDTFFDKNNDYGMDHDGNPIYNKSNKQVSEERASNKKLSHLTDGQYRRADMDLLESGGERYASQPLNVKQKLIRDYGSDRTDGSEYWSHSHGPRPTNQQALQNQYDSYLELHPSSELTFNEFNNWFYEA